MHALKCKRAHALINALARICTHMLTSTRSHAHLNIRPTRFDLVLVGPSSVLLENMGHTHNSMGNVDKVSRPDTQTPAAYDHVVRL